MSVFTVLIDLIILSALVYIFRANKTYFVVCLLIILLFIFIIPDILLPSFLWEIILKVSN